MAAKKARTTKLCDRCHGTGLVPDPVATGHSLAKVRKNSGLSLHQLAARLKISTVYLWNLEKGRRRWTEELKVKYLEAVSL